MSEKSLKANRRALRRIAMDEKNNIVSRYMTENWDKVIVSAVTIIRQFPFKERFDIAMTIIFKPIKIKKPKVGSDITPDCITAPPCCNVET
jgi:hypothetical protein